MQYNQPFYVAGPTPSLPYYPCFTPPPLQPQVFPFNGGMAATTCMPGEIGGYQPARRLIRHKKKPRSVEPADKKYQHNLQAGSPYQSVMRDKQPSLHRLQLHHHHHALERDQPEEDTPTSDLEEDSPTNDDFDARYPNSSGLSYNGPFPYVIGKSAVQLYFLPATKFGNYNNSQTINGSWFIRSVNNRSIMRPTPPACQQNNRMALTPSFAPLCPGCQTRSR